MVAKRKKNLDTIEFSSDQWSLVELINLNKDHQLAFQINELLGIDLEREQDFEYFIQDSESRYYPLFSYTDELLQRLYVLIRTHDENQVSLSKEFTSPQSRLFFIFGHEHEKAALHFENMASQMPNTLFVQKFDFLDEAQAGSAVAKQKQRLAKFLNEVLLPELEMCFFE